MVYRRYKKTNDFRKFKTIVVFGNEITNNIVNMLWSMINKTIWQTILKNLKLKQNHKINLILEKVKEDVINSVMSLLKGREMVFKAFESGIFSKLKESEQSEQLTDDAKYKSFGYDTYKLSRKLEWYRQYR